ncbi:MAG: carboxylesterase family protein [Promethearchaeota archaeon]
MKRSVLKTRILSLIIKNYNWNIIFIVLNVLSILIGMLYFIFQNTSIFPNFLGFILLFTFFGNILKTYLNIKHHQIKSLNIFKLQIINYSFLSFIMIASIAILGGNLLRSAATPNNISFYIGGYFLTNFFFFGTLIFGIACASLNLKYGKYKRNYSSTNNEKKRKKKSLKYFILILKIIFKNFSKVLYFLGILFAIVITFGSFEFITTFIAIISAQFGPFFSLIFATNTILYLLLNKKKWSVKKYKRKRIIGLLVSFVLILPLLSSWVIEIQAKAQFSIDYGNGWEEKIPADKREYFLQEPFSSTVYILGAPRKACKVKLNILYYEEEHLKLYFDVYMPFNRGKGLPGQNSTLIRIHGGSWTSGDKGPLNNVQMNTYFASQGYIVFDIQYGLHETILSLLDPTTPKYSLGNYNINDMIKHIGIFTKYLTNNSAKFGANLSSVFFSGGSSGGHLASVAALAIASKNYSNYFSSNITVKGFIPFYPANGQMIFFGINGKKEFMNPELMVNKYSPPCLIFQGTHDILNYFNIARKFKKAYLDNGNPRCTILWMTFGGHGSDFYFSGYYNQIFLYYMERFMYMYR